jgi:hypothetical protein
LFILGLSVLNIVQFNTETPKMQTLALEVATTFVDDAAALVTGCGRIIVQILSSPIERLANACDVAGVLPRRRALRHSWANRQAMRRQRSWRNCLFPLRGLRDLT